MERQALEGHSALMTDYERLIVEKVRRHRLAHPESA